MANVAQRSFAAGELGPLLYARTDLEKYGAGARLLRNFVVRRQGGIDNRAGTELVGAAPIGSRARLLPFVFNDAQAYVLEFSNRLIRFARAGAILSASGGVPYSIASPYCDCDLAALQISQSADVVTIVHPSYPTQELRRFGDTNWTLTPLVTAPAIGGVTGIAASGGTAGVAVFWAITALSSATGEEGLPVFFSSTNVPSTGTPTTVTWAPLGGALGYMVYRSPDGVTFGLVGPAAGVPQAKSTTGWVTNTASIATTGTVFVPSLAQARSSVVGVVADKAYDGQYTLTGRVTLTVSGTPGGVNQTSIGRLRIFYSRDGEPRVDAGVFADVAVQFNDGTLTRPLTGTVFVPDNGYATLVLDVVPEVESGYFGVSSTCTVDYSTGPNNLIAWKVTKTGYLDVGGAPNYGIAPPSQRTLFKSAGDYPGAVGTYQGRRLLAGTTNAPETIWTSRSASPRSFTVSSPSQDDDAITFTLLGNKVNQIRHLVDASVFMVFTSGGEWIIDGDTSGVLRPTEINARNFSGHGASLLPPLKIDRRVLYVQARQSIVRDIAKDPWYGYRGNDLTSYATHLFEGHTLLEWCYQEQPHSIVWAVRDDGVLLGRTDCEEEQVGGWHHHDTLGTFESCCTIPEGTEDRLYLVVNRNGVRLIERMASRFFTDPQDAILTDSTLSYDGRNTNPAHELTIAGPADGLTGALYTVASTSAMFSTGNVGDGLVFTLADGTLLRTSIDAYIAPDVVQVHPARNIPVAMLGVATSQWSLAVRGVSGLGHLEGRAVSVVGDGTVVANPNNPRYTTTCVVTGGAVTFDRPYSYIHVGLPYVSDLQTLDVDTPDGPSLRERPLLINALILEVVASSGIFAGGEAPASDSTLGKLLQFKLRNQENFGEPVRLATGYIRITTQDAWDRSKNGQVFVRQCDPVPLTILAAIPVGVIPPAPAQ